MALEASLRVRCFGFGVQASGFRVKQGGPGAHITVEKRTRLLKPHRESDAWRQPFKSGVTPLSSLSAIRAIPAL